MLKTSIVGCTEKQMLIRFLHLLQKTRPISKPTSNSPALRAAFKEAHKASEKFCKISKEAVLAWETVEEIASSDSSAAILGQTDDECLVNVIEGCKAITELFIAIGKIEP